jgi:malate dehydrogenase (oxaloacetate-decarboxylating)
MWVSNEDFRMTPLDERAIALHEQQKGKLHLALAVPLETKEDLSLAYTPGVAAPCRDIAAHPERVRDLTVKAHTIAVVTDGSAVLGLGNIGPEASLPVMEGKAALFKRFAGLDAFPIALATQDTQEIVDTVLRIAPVFGGVNLEDIASPRCFEVERQLKERLTIPVMHDDQHGTAIVILAGLLNALRVVGKELGNVRIAVSGAGAAGIASAGLLWAAGARDIVLVDRVGILHRDRTDMNAEKREVAAYNPRGISGGLQEAMEGADVFIGVSAAGVCTPNFVRSMAPKAIVCAMANPVPEILPEEARAAGAMVVATGRSDYPNQLNNVLAFPGLFKGALRARVTQITTAMELAAAQAIAALVPDPVAEHIVPSVFEIDVAEAVAQAVVASAGATP